MTHSKGRHNLSSGHNQHLLSTGVKLILFRDNVLLGFCLRLTSSYDRFFFVLNCLELTPEGLGEGEAGGHKKESPS